MHDFLSFLIIAATFVLAAVVNAKKTKAKEAQKPHANPTPAAPHRETLEEYMERQRKAAEARLKEAEEARRLAAEEAAARKEKKAAEAARRRIEEDARKAAEKLKAEMMLREEDAVAAGAVAEEGIAATSADSIGDLETQAAPAPKPLALDPKEMVIYSEIMAPKFEEY